MNCDILVFAPHPDDAEIHCGASIAKQTRLGSQVVIIDATRGESASRGTPQGRAIEAQAAADILAVSARENLDLGDGTLNASSLEARQAIVHCIRTHTPRLVLCISPDSHHPDHRALGHLVMDSIKTAALHNVPGQTLPAHQNVRMLCYESELAAQRPVMLVPCSETDWKRKMAAVRCYSSQLFQKDSDQSAQPVTSIGTEAFQTWIEARGRSWGQQVNAPYAEAFYAPLHPLAVDDLSSLWPEL